MTLENMMLTDSESKTYDFIRHYIDRHGYAPKLPEIAEGIGIQSTGVVHRYLQSLIHEGLIEVTPYRHRGIRLVAPNERDYGDLRIPLIGQIAAGQPIEAIEQEEVLDLANLVSRKKTYALRVKGDSMIDEGILDGDIVICEKAITAPEGAIVVALVDNSEATLKRIKYHNKNMVTLLPANPKYSPQIYKAEQVRIQGIFLGLIRL